MQIGEPTEFTTKGEELGKGVGSTYTNRVDGRSSSRGNKIGWELNKAGRSTHYELGFFVLIQTRATPTLFLFRIRPHTRGNL